MNIERLRQRVKQRLQEVEALGIVSYQMNDISRSQIDKARLEIQHTSSKRLREISTLSERYFDELRKKSGLTGSISDVLHIFKTAGGETEETIFLVPKWQLEQIFKRYGDCFPGWGSCPAHAMIPISCKGDLDEAMETGVYLPEALVYEDMCAAYNQASRSTQNQLKDASSRVEGKTHNMAVRTAILCAYYFVEAYLNAIAFDFWSKEKEKLSQEDTDCLLEWDSKKLRQRWISLEEKTNRYPRIILRVQHCPVMESNCDELRFLLNEGKRIRDSIVHASPKLNPKTMEFEKLSNIIMVDVSKATVAVDSATGYVRRLNAALGVHGCDLSWVVNRGESGTFPDDAFM